MYVGHTYGHASERATQRLSGSGECARSRASIVSGWRERCPGIPRFGRWRARVEGIWVVARAAPRFMEPQPIDTVRIAHQRRLHQSSVGRRRCGVRAICVFSRAHWAPTSERGWGASLNLTRTNSLDAPGRYGADEADSERQRCRGRAVRPRVRWFASRDASASLAHYDCERFSGCERVVDFGVFLFLLIWLLVS